MTLYNFDAGTALDLDVLPLTFPPAATTTKPVIVIAPAPPGAEPGRVFGTLLAEHGPDTIAVRAEDLRALHPTYLKARPTPDEAQGFAEATTQWMRVLLKHARETRRSVIFEAAFQAPGLASALSGSFHGDGFSTRVVAVVPHRADTLLARLSKYLIDLQTGARAQFVSRAEHDQTWARTRGVIEEAQGEASIDRITVYGGDGRALFDSTRSASDLIAGAVRTFDQGRAQRMGVIATVQWLSELRRVSEFVTQLRTPPAPIIEILVDLHETGLREIVPQLPLEARSEAIRVQEERMAERLVDLRRLVARPQPQRAPGPVIDIGGPERSGISL